MASRITNVLFDLGNVVFRIHFDRCFQLWSEKTGVAPEQILEIFQKDPNYERHERSELTGEQYFETINQNLGGQLTSADFLKGWNSIFGDPVAETIQFMHENSKRLRFDALTNSNVLHRMHWMPLYQKELRYFSKIFCSSQLKQRKPEPAIFQSILKDLQVKPEEIVFVDDLLENIQAARALGFQVIHFQNPASDIEKLRQLIG